MFEIDVRALRDGRLFLSRTLVRGDETGEISHAEEEALRQEIATLSHKLITIKTEDVSSLSELRQQIQDAFRLVSLGLEYGSNGDLDRSVRLLKNNRVVKFFQIGNTLADELVERCRDTLENAVLISPECAAPARNNIDAIPVYNDWERQFLGAINEFKLIIESPQVTLRGVASSRPITNLMDLAVVRQQLDNLDYRLAYIRALPIEKVLDAEYRSNADNDSAREITIALMVNLVLYHEVDFHLDPNDLRSLCDIAYDSESGAIRSDCRGRLIDWIERYLDLAELPDQVKDYAVAYWQETLKILESEFIL